MLRKYSDLNEMAKDALRELGNIGTGNAATALSAMTNQEIDLEIPVIRIVPYQDAPGLLGGAEIVETGILLEVSHDLKGIFMFLLNEDFTARMLQKLLGCEIVDVRRPDEMSKSAICETGNIMCCSYINALSQMLDMQIHVSVPSVCCDMAGALLSVPMIRFANLGDELMFIDNRFCFDDASFVCHVLFLPELDSLKNMLDTLGLSYE